ncbi:uncharacterized protein LOC116424255 [Nomia melanderi]|uniref:uncharacterized protein LOC116424255 n=1 Tax=Nomia melanderi TaxID=2448451 RepID=UPI0013042672|nr:uncharacterized protein LOC116424255 [Nomia melanderi]
MSKYSEIDMEAESIMRKMQKVEDALQDSLHRVHILENRLKTKLLTMENRERLETELEEVKEVLKRNEEKLLSLRKQNRKTYMVAASMVFACFLLYGLYLMIYGKL